MSIVAPTFSRLVDFNETNMDRNDFEVEEILNDIGFFAQDDAFIAGEPEPGLPMNFELQIQAPSSVSSLFHTQSKPFSNVTITPSTSTQDIQAFSVPNPIAALERLNDVSPPPTMAPIEEPRLFTPPTKVQAKPDIKKDTKPRKRKLADQSVPSSIACDTKTSPDDVLSSPRSKDDGLTEDELEERRQRNREHAKRSRQRKKSLTSTLQQSVDDLKAENVKLRQQIHAAIGAEKTKNILAARKSNARASFMASLMKPQNRVADDKTLTFLRSLSKSVSSTNSDN